MTSHAASAAWLRLMIQAQLQAGWITPAFAEQAYLHVNVLEQSAQLGQQLGALGMAVTAQTVVPPGPSLRVRHDGTFTTEPRTVKESAADRNAREQAASIGYTYGKAAA